MLLQIWRSLDGFQGRSNADTWVYRVALNTAISHRRRRGVRERHVSATEIDPDAMPGAAASGREELRILEEFMASLEEIDRALFALYLEVMEEVRRRATRFNRQIRQRDLLETGAGLVVIGMLPTSRGSCLTRSRESVRQSSSPDACSS
jgi:Sigma-70 region 2